MCWESRLKAIHHAIHLSQAEFLCSPYTIITKNRLFEHGKVDIMLYNHLKSYVELYENKFHICLKNYQLVYSYLYKLQLLS